MPTWKELAEQLGQYLEVDEQILQIKKHDPPQLFQLYEDKIGRPELIRLFCMFLHLDKINPSIVHKRFASIPYFRTVCTTNYDNLLETAYRNNNIPVRTIVEKFHIALYGNSSEMKVLKMHGDFEHPNELIITAFDYKKQSGKKEAFKDFLQTELITKTPIYIGFSLDDPLFLHIKSEVDTWLETARWKGHIILFDPSVEEIEKYTGMNLRIISIQTNGKPISDSILELINEINQTEIDDDFATLSVSINKPILFRNQTLQIRVNAVDSREQIIVLIKNESGNNIHEKILNCAQVISDGIFEDKIELYDEKWVEAKNYVVCIQMGNQRIYDSFTIISAKAISIQTDRTTYTYGREIILTIIAPHAYKGTSIHYGIFDIMKNNIEEGAIPVITSDERIFQTRLTIKGNAWKNLDSYFMIKVDYLDMYSSVRIYVSQLNVALQLDHSVYSFRQKVKLTVVAPDFVFRQNEINSIGDSEDALLTIKSSLGTIPKYRLEETQMGSGIFIGELLLSGIKENDTSITPQKRFPVETSKCGPTDGLLVCSNDDYIFASLQIPNHNSIKYTAKITASLATMSFDKESYHLDDYVYVTVVDHDMSINPNTINQINVHVYSDSNKTGIDISLSETEHSAGIFQGTFWITSKKILKSPFLYASKGDTITVKYVDSTLPPPYSICDSLEITTTAVIE